MTEDDIKLVIAEVCARLPYGLKFHFYPDAESVLKDNRQKEVIATATGYDGDYQCVETKTEGFNVRNIKLYLRPMSSMTEEEKYTYRHMLGGTINSEGESIMFVYVEDLPVVIDWLIKNKFDYRGMIEKGLAIDLATLDND